MSDNSGDHLPSYFCLLSPGTAGLWEPCLVHQSCPRHTRVFVLASGRVAFNIGECGRALVFKKFFIEGQLGGPLPYIKKGEGEGGRGGVDTGTLMTRGQEASNHIRPALSSCV